MMTTMMTMMMVVNDAGLVQGCGGSASLFLPGSVLPDAGSRR